MKGVFLKKEEDGKIDGVAIYYDAARFNMLFKFELPFNQNPYS
jgi:hypothetical protein